MSQKVRYIHNQRKSTIVIELPLHEQGSHLALLS